MSWERAAWVLGENEHHVPSGDVVADAQEVLGPTGTGLGTVGSTPRLGRMEPLLLSLSFAVVAVDCVPKFSEMPLFRRWTRIPSDVGRP